MTNEELKKIGISDELIESVMKLHTKSMAETKKQVDEAAKLSARVTEYETQLAEANKTIEGFKGMDIDSIKKSADDWKIKYEEAEKTATERIESISREAFAKEYAAGLQFSSKAAKNQFVKDLLGEKLKFKDGTFMGVDDFHKKYAEQDPDAFKNQEQQPAGQVDFGAGHESKPAQNVGELINKGVVDMLKK